MIQVHTNRLCPQPSVQIHAQAALPVTLAQVESMATKQANLVKEAAKHVGQVGTATRARVNLRARCARSVKQDIGAQKM